MFDVRLLVPRRQLKWRDGCAFGGACALIAGSLAPSTPRAQIAPFFNLSGNWVRDDGEIDQIQQTGANIVDTKVTSSTGVPAGAVSFQASCSGNTCQGTANWSVTGVSQLLTAPVALAISPDGATIVATWQSSEVSPTTRTYTRQ